MAQQIITLARDADLESLPDGSPSVYWSDAATWGWCAGAAGVRMQALVLATTPSTFAVILGQYSNDGRTWFDFESTIDGQTTPDALDPTNGKFSIRQHAGPPWEMAPYVRYGLRVWRTGGGQGRVRMTCDLIVLARLDAAKLFLADGAVIDAPGQIGGIECTYGYDRGSIYIHATAFSGITSVTVVVETSLVRDPPEEGWRPVATVPTLSAFNESTEIQFAEVSGLDAYTRLRATAVTGTGTVEFSSHAFLRPAN